MNMNENTDDASKEMKPKKPRKQYKPRKPNVIKAAREDENAMITAKEVAALCNIGHTTFYKLYATGKVPRKVKFGVLVRWRRREIIDWLKAGCPSREKWEAMQGKR